MTDGFNTGYGDSVAPSGCGAPGGFPRKDAHSNKGLK